MTKNSLNTFKKALYNAAKTNSKRLHIIPYNGHWSLKKEGNKRASAKFNSKEEAIQSAQSMEGFTGGIVIHYADGSLDTIT